MSIEELTEDNIFMSSNENFSSIFKSEQPNNSNLYSFLATNYDISNLAKSIVAKKSASANLLSLKKYGNVSI
jgi:hypothetical protein